MSQAVWSVCEKGQNDSGHMGVIQKHVTTCTGQENRVGGEGGAEEGRKTKKEKGE